MLEDSHVNGWKSASLQTPAPLWKLPEIIRIKFLFSFPDMLGIFICFFILPGSVNASDINIYQAKIAAGKNGSPPHPDGNTSLVTLGENPGEPIVVRWQYTDAPEIGKSSNKKCNGQPYAVEAREVLNKYLPEGSAVAIYAKGKDLHGALVAEVYFEGRNMNLWMVRQGYAEVAKGWKAPKLYIEAEDIARSEKKGVWGLAEYESPLEYRKRCFEKIF